MPEVWSIGPFNLRSDWVLLLLAGLAGYAGMYIQLKRGNPREMGILSVIADALLIAFAAWKFSPLFFTPSLLWEAPSALLLMSGSAMGMWIGVLLALLYMNVKMRRLHFSRWSALDLMAVGVMTGTIAYNMLGWRYGTPTEMPWGITIGDPLIKYHPLNLYLLLVALPLFLRLWRHPNSLGEGRRFAEFLLYFGMGLMAVSFFAVKQPLAIGLSIEQTGYAAMMLIGFYLNWRVGKKVGTEF